MVGKLKALSQFLSKTKHKNKKYFVEFFNFRYPDKESLEFDVNVIPTEDYTSYDYESIIDCYVDEVITFGCELVGINFPEKLIDKTYFNGKKCSRSDFSFSSKFSDSVETYANEKLNINSINVYHDGVKYVVKFYYKHTLSHVDRDYEHFYFHFNTDIYDIEINDSSVVVKDYELIDSISNSIFMLTEDYRDDLSNYCWHELNEDQDIMYCDVYTTVSFYVDYVLGKKTEPTDWVSSLDILKSKLADYIESNL